MNGQIPICTEGCIVDKNWGKEIVFVNNELYCGKILVFKRGFKFSLHYHVIKQETWYVQSGSFIFNWIDTEHGKTHTMELFKGDSVTIPRGMPHQLHAITDGEIFEVSTQHFDSDSYRIEKGN
jgi:mannose-6-phosphate isomerase-like protein (cupin superfamily)